MGEEIADLGERPIETDDLDDLGVFGGDFKALDQRGRQSGAAHGGEALDLFQRQHGHQAAGGGGYDFQGAISRGGSIDAGTEIFFEEGGDAFKNFGAGFFAPVIVADAR